MMNKKAISTLVSTIMIIAVLCLLGVVVMSFSDMFTRDVLSGAATSTKKELTCINDVIIDLQSACVLDDDTIQLYVASNGLQKIEGFKVRMYSKNKEGNSVDIPGFEKFMAGNLESTWQGKAKDVVYVEVLPKIDFENKITICPNAKRQLGYLEGAKPFKVCS